MRTWPNRATNFWKYTSMKKRKTVESKKPLKITKQFSATNLEKKVLGHIGLQSYRCSVKVKVKCTLVQALRLCTGRTAHRGSRGIALLFHDHGTRRGWGDSVMPRPLFTPEKDPVPIVQEAGWAPGPVWTGAENLPPPPPGFDPWTVQPVASRYTDYATRPIQI